MMNVFILSGDTGDRQRETPQHRSRPAGLGLMETAKTRPGTIVSEIGRARTGDMETLSFALTEPKGGGFFGRFEPNARNRCWSSSFPKRFAARRPF
jgi:hypothetical protein